MNSLWGSTSSNSRPGAHGTRQGKVRAVAARVLVFAGAGFLAVLGLSGHAAPSATAAPDPCAASQVAKTVAMVATHTGNYLEANPRANQAITAISQQQGGPQSVAALKTYFDANPVVAGDLQRLQQPLVALSATCKLPVTLPQLFGLMQAAQQSQVVPTSQNAAVATGTAGPLPAPGAAGTR